MTPLLARQSALLDRHPRGVLAGLLAFGFVFHLLYLGVNPPIDLSGDEAQYWEWSRNPDIAYYSKGPLVAWIIRVFTAVLGDHMLVVRLPAMVLAVGTSLCTYWLTLRLFRSHRLALGTVALTYIVPIFVLGSMLMTIDPPFYFCWALATCLAARAVFDRSRAAWVGVGVVIGLGLLAKYAAPLWFVGVFAFLLADRQARAQLRTPWPYAAVLIAAAFFLVPLYWNWQNGWVTVRHVARQIGVNRFEGTWYLNLLELLAIQFAVLLPTLAGMMIAAVVLAMSRWKRSPSARTSRGLLFLISIGGTFILVCLLQSTRTRIEANWLAPAYFTLTIVAAWWVAQHLRSPGRWQRIRGLMWTHVVIGLIAATLVHYTDQLYPLLERAGIKPRQIDAQFVKMRGNAEAGRRVGELLADMPPGTFLLTRKYQDAALLSFYTPGRPPAFHIGSYLRGPEQSRYSQWDLWPDRDLSPQRSPVIGRDALIVSEPQALDGGGVIAGAFDRVEFLQTIAIIRHGLQIRELQVYRGYNFRGVVRDGEATH